MSFVRWDNKPESDRLSPWDLEPIDENRRPNSVDRLPVLPSEIVRTLYRPRPEDWGDDLETECDRISAALGQVMKLAESEPFASPVNANFCPYPMDLSTIKKRLDNRFYRRKEAVLFDLSYVFTKAESNNIRSASIIKNLCLEIIGNRDAVDVICQRVLEKFREGGAEENDDGPGTSGAATTANTRSRIYRNLQISDSEPEKEKSKSSKSRNATATCKSKVNLLKILLY